MRLLRPGIALLTKAAPYSPGPVGIQSKKIHINGDIMNSIKFHSYLLLSIVIVAMTSLHAHAEYRYVECTCGVDFMTPEGETIHISDYVYCPTSDEYDFVCYGNVIGWSLDTICENGDGDSSKRPNWDAPRNSTEIPNTLSCSL